MRWRDIFYPYRAIAVIALAFVLGSLWGKLIDATVTFSAPSLIIEASGATMLGGLAPYLTSSWWLRPLK